MVSASPWSWVTKTKVMPTSRWIRLSSSCIASRSLRSRAASGSSSRSAAGMFTSARARATRCCWPPESWLGRRLANSLSWTTRASRRPRRGLGRRDLAWLRRPNADVVERSTCGGTGRTAGTPCSRCACRAATDETSVALEEDRALRRRLEAGDHPQHRGLAAAGRAEQREELARARSRSRRPPRRRSR